MFYRILFLTLFTLPAQESASAIPRNETGLRNAIAGLGKKLVRPAQQRLRIAAPGSGACSVALQTMPIENPERFTLRKVPPADVAPMPQVALPAPPCETATR